MCTIAILVNACDAPLAIAANRDELYARASRPPERLAPGLVATGHDPGGDSLRIAGGVDAVGGGTWLAVRADGVFAAVTNQHGAIAPHGARSRGLVVRELAASADPDAYVAALDPTAYASMNLAWGDARRGARVAYLRTAGTRDVIRLPDGVHVLCNDQLGAHFARGARLHAAIERQLAASARWADLAAALPAMLADHTMIDSPLDANCIHSPVYGTRCATLAAFDPGAVRAYLHADGPPCVTPFVDRLELLR